MSIYGKLLDEIDGAFDHVTAGMDLAHGDLKMIDHEVKLIAIRTALWELKKELSVLNRSQVDAVRHQVSQRQYRSKKNSREI